ncbi:MAG: hypothetical protein R2827_16765 [Bdellovibrionales bacterium]
MYLIKHFGISGRYIQIQKVESSNLVEFSGTRSEVEAFIDYGIFRFTASGSANRSLISKTGSTLKKPRRYSSD